MHEPSPGEWGAISDILGPSVRLCCAPFDSEPSPGRFSGLENMIPNSYVNAWIHTAFFILPLRAHMLNQLSSKEVCRI